VVGHPHVEVGNAERLIGEGFRFLMCAPGRTYASLDKARELIGRK
jgi:4-hydroxy-2-oxoheptanedioate aldolase